MILRKKQSKKPVRRMPGAIEQKKSDVFSYYSNRSNVNNTSSPAREGRGVLPTPGWQKWRYLPSYLAFVAVLVSIVYLLSVDVNPKIVVPVSNTPGLLREQNVYQQAAQDILKSSIFNRSKITIDTLGVQREFERQFPEIEAASILLPITARRPVITLQPAEPALIIVTSGKQHIVDAHGRVILAASEATKAATAGLPVVVDESGLPAELGQTVLPRATSDFIITLVAQLQAKKLVVQSLTLPTLANELHIRIADQPYVLKFNTLNDARTSAGTFLALKLKLDADKTTPSEYIDLRVEERAYYR